MKYENNNFILVPIIFVLSYLLSYFMFIEDLGGDSYFGFALLIIVGVGLYTIKDRKKMIDNKLDLSNKFPKLLNNLVLVIIYLLFLIGLILFIKIYSFVQVDYSSEGWSQMLDLLTRLNNLYVITSLSILASFTFIYSLVWNLKIENSGLIKSILASIKYLFIKSIWFITIAICIRITFYFIMLMTLGIQGA